MPQVGRETLRILFCRQDNVTITLNGTQYEIKSRNILIAFPGDIIKIAKYGQSFSGSYLSVSLKLLEQFSLFLPQNGETYSTIKEVRQFCLEESNIQLLYSYLNLWETRLKYPMLVGNNAGLYSLTSIFIRDFLNITAKQYHKIERLK